MDPATLATGGSGKRKRVKERVEREIFRRAVLGVERAVWHKGEVVGHEAQYSDRLLLALARRVDPTAWGELPAAANPQHRGEAELVRRLLANPAAMELAQRLSEVLEPPGQEQRAPTATG